MIPGVAGMESYCDRYSQTIYDVSVTSGPVPKFEGPLIKEINEQLCAKVPIEKLPERRAWRDACLTKLSTLKKEMNNWSVSDMLEYALSFVAYIKMMWKYCRSK